MLLGRLDRLCSIFYEGIAVPHRLTSIALPRPDLMDGNGGDGGNRAVTRHPTALLAASLVLSALLVALLAAVLRY
jgi:hypothetical protein